MPRSRKQARKEDIGGSSRVARSKRRNDFAPPTSSSSEEEEVEHSEGAAASSSEKVSSTSPENSSSADLLDGDEADLPFDHTRFRNQSRQEGFERYWSHKPVLCERGIRLTDFPAIRTTITGRGWVRAMTFRASADPMLVREFYSNIKVYSTRAGLSQILVRVRGRRLRFKASTIASFLDIPRVDVPGYPFPEDSRPSRDVLASTLSDGAHRSWGFVPQFPKKRLSSFCRVLHELSCSQIFPIVHDDLLSQERALLLYAIATDVLIDLASVIFDTIVQRASITTGRSVLPFGGLITELLAEFGVIIDETARTVSPSALISESTGARRIAQLRLRESSFSDAGPSTSSTPPVRDTPPRPRAIVLQRDLLRDMDDRLRHVEAEQTAQRHSLDGIVAEQAAQRRLLESQGVTLDSILAALRALGPTPTPPPPPPPYFFDPSFARPPSP